MNDLKRIQAWLTEQSDDREAVITINVVDKTYHPITDEVVDVECRYHVALSELDMQDDDGCIEQKAVGIGKTLDEAVAAAFKVMETTP